jgi:hypothetical protein
MTIKQGFFGNLAVGQRVGSLHKYGQGHKYMYIHGVVAGLSAAGWCDHEQINSVQTFANSTHLAIMGLISED